MTAHPSVDNLHRCWDSVDELVGGLTADQWATPSLCPDWTVRGVIEHLGAVEHMLVGRAPDSMPDALPFHEIGAWLAEVADLTDAEMLKRYRDVIRQRRVELDGCSADDFAAPCMTPVGPGTYGRFMNVRVFDSWVHEQDMRVPLGLPGHETGPAADVALAEVESSLGYIVGRKVALPDGKGLTIQLTGPVERTYHVRVDGRAAQVPELADADVVLRSDSTTFALLACGRIDPQGPIDDGRVTWTGDDELGDRAARNLAFTM